MVDKNVLAEPHVPVLLDEVLEYLAPAPGMVFVDATVGAGGHSKALLERIAPDGRLIGLDRDPEALAAAAEALAAFGGTVTLVQSRFDRLEEVLREQNCSLVDGVLMDLGVSSMQLDRPERGFSFSQVGPLDMRMEQGMGRTAAEIIALESEQELASLFYRYGEDRWSRRIARRIVEERARRKLTKTTELAAIISGAVPRKAWPQGIHPATRVFMSLRIAVNEELSQIEPAIRQGVRHLRPGGRLAAISFHSLEDRIVKQCFHQLSGACTCPPGFPVCVCGARAEIKILTKKPLMASEQEQRRNPRSRSAKLRVAERTEG